MLLNHVTNTKYLQGVPNIVQIEVGGTLQSEGGIYQFIPANITAANGTVIDFIFNGM